MNDHIFQISEKRIADIKKEAEEEYYRRYRSALREEIEALFKNRVMFCGKEHTPAGPMRDIIQEQVTSFFLQDKTAERISRYIEEALMPQLQSCIDDCVRHTVRREQFQNIKQRCEQQIDGLNIESQ